MSVILFFVKYPEAGRVKTRLAAQIGPEAAAGLYRGFILDMLAGLEAAGRPFRLCYDPPERGEALKSWLGGKFLYRPQQGADLGARMLNAFLETFGDGYTRVALVGSDLPDLPASLFNEAIDALAGRDAVLGPALDGGYYLIGFRREAFSTEVFEGMAWGRDTVFRETLVRLRRAGRRVRILPPWPDVDDLADLEELVRRAGSAGFSGSKTMAYVSGHGVLDRSHP